MPPNPYSCHFQQACKHVIDNQFLLFLHSKHKFLLHDTTLRMMPCIDWDDWHGSNLLILLQWLYFQSCPRAKFLTICFCTMYAALLIASFHKISNKCDVLGNFFSFFFTQIRSLTHSKVYPPVNFIPLSNTFLMLESLNFN